MLYLILPHATKKKSESKTDLVLSFSYFYHLAPFHTLRTYIPCICGPLFPMKCYPYEIMMTS